MSTVQIVGVGAAAAVLVVLVVLLIVLRRRGEHEAPDTPAVEERTGGSFLDAPPKDTLAELGTPDSPDGEPVEVGCDTDELRLDWRDGDAAAPPGAAAAPPDDEQALGGDAVPAADESDTSREAAAPPRAEQAAAPAGRRMVPLSSIIVTTSDKMVDLDDLEVRRMLTELVGFEIDQATQYRAAGQTLDAVLQLTEAEKISRALGLDEAAERIRQMMDDLRAG